jgi:HD-like signal output (HDOD) protein
MIEKRQLVGVIRQLPTMPRALVEMQRLLKQQNVNSERLERIILTDPALTANILRLANSAAFGLTRKVANVSQAVTLMGQRALSNLAHTAAFSQAIPKEFPGYRITAAQFLRHSFAVGVLAEALGAACRMPQSEPFYVAGLLHDIGKLVLGAYVAKHDSELLQILESKSLAFVQIERELLGIDHCQVAMWVGEHWKLPVELLGAARWHHAPDESRPETQAIADVVHVADLMAHTLGFGADVGELARSTAKGSLERLSLDVDTLESVASNVLERLNQEIAQEHEHHEKLVAKGTLRILVIDDSVLNREMVIKSLLSAGLPPHTVVQAGDGAEARTLLKETGAGFDLVLVDDHSPNMTGTKLVSSMAQSGELQRTAVVVITTEANPVILARLRALGVRAFLKKPLRPEQFRVVIKPILRNVAGTK